jgi:hypothetical protein
VSYDGLCLLWSLCFAGNKWVRILYLDESGIGNIANDPDLVVAGVLVHGDRQWIPLKNHLLSLLRSYVPQGAPTPKFLHAVDIYHGYGEFSREI